MKRFENYWLEEARWEEEQNRRRSEKRRRTREDRRARAREQMLTIIGVCLFLLVALLATTVYAESRYEEKTEIAQSTDDGRLPGDDAPATERCYLTEAELEEQEDMENEKIEAALLSRSSVIENCTVTFYCAERYKHICGTGDVIAYDGTPVIPWATCAVDPSVIPLGSTILVDLGDGYGLRTLVSNDTGVNGNHIDICVPTHSEALDLGIKTLTVYWCEEGAA